MQITDRLKTTLKWIS